MRRFLGAVLATAFLIVPAWADDKDAQSILDKAINALGGAEKLGKVSAFSWKAKLTVTFNGKKLESTTTSQVTIKDLDHYRREFGNDQSTEIVVLADTKGWRKVGDNSEELEGEALASEKRKLYLQVIPITLVPLKGKGFKYEAAAEEKVGDKPATVLKATGPDGKDFTLYFDKESGVPVKQVFKFLGFQGREFTPETTFADYKDFGGIKKATKVEVKLHDEHFESWELTEFKVLDKVNPETFTEPK